MVEHPGEYPWSSFSHNALGMSNPILTPHYLYQALGNSEQIRQENYLRLFDTHIPLETLENIREMTNKAWVLGSDLFKQKIQNELQRPVTACSKGGDRKSQDFHLNRNNSTQAISIKKVQ
jgi:putative transposase